MATQRPPTQLSSDDDDDDAVEPELICGLYDRKRKRQCPRTFHSHTDLLRHQRSSHGRLGYRCPRCQERFRTARALRYHPCGGDDDQDGPDPNLQNLSSLPLESDISTFHRSVMRRDRILTIIRYQPLESTNDYQQVLQDLRDDVPENLQRGLHEYDAHKFQLKMAATFRKDTDAGETDRFVFSPKAREVLVSDSVMELYSAIARVICQLIEDWMQKNSGWEITEVNFVDLQIVSYRPMGGGGSYIPTPVYLKGKRAIVNVKSRDNRCFMWSILARLHPAVHNPNRLTHYRRYRRELNFTGIEFPVTLRQIDQFEAQNDMAVNVYGYNRRGLYPLRITRRREDHRSVVHLLQLTRGARVHYCLVKSVDRLLANINRSDHRMFHCPFCLFPYATSERRDEHVVYCQEGNQRVEMPEEGSTLKFHNVKRQMTVPLVIYADFECFVKPLDSCIPNPGLSSTTSTHHHVANSFAAVAARNCGCGDETRFGDYFLYRGADPSMSFLDYCLRMGQEYQMQFDAAEPMDMQPANWAVYRTATVCSICQQQLERNEYRVRDHCHLCGRFRGVAHNKCNMDLQMQRDIPVVLHNLRRYDSHLIMQAVGEFARRHALQIGCVPKGMEDYLTFSLRCPHRTPWGSRVTFKLRFIDSFQFLSSSLESLAANLLGRDSNGEAKFCALATRFPLPADRQLLLRKGVYPYEYVDRDVVFQEVRLPPKERFYSSLKDSGISNADYQHAEHVWNHFGLNTFGQYHDLYLATDVLLLADVFESFRRNSMSHYQLDPVHYITLPSFAWDACLKFSGVELELLSEPDIYQFFESSIRGGISMISGRYAKANNPLIPGYNDKEPCTYIKYYDANNLYGWSMLQPLPVSGFRWMTEDEIEDFVNDLDQIPDDAPVGYVLEVDLEYPEELHDLHSDYPLAAESLVISDEMLSQYTLDLKEHFSVTTGGVVRKLTPNLFDKHRYVVHYRNLKYYVSQGMRIRVIHRGVRFEQRPWMKTYIEFNTRQRAMATTSFEKDLFKLLNNAVFGKSMENVRKYKDVRLVADRRRIQRLVASPRFKEIQEFGGELFAVSLEHEVVNLNKPIDVGFVVLETSKLLIYQFHYNYIKAKFGGDAKLLFTDTDSLCYLFHTRDIYQDIAADSDLFDFSDYPQNHFLYSVVNKKVIGKMKDETNGKAAVAE